MFLVLANVFVWKEVLSFSNKLEVVFFDMGQGDSIFIETGQGHQILIDGGPGGERILEKLSGEMPFWDRSIDLVILTHPDYDHLRGLLDVLDRYKVENILWTGVKRETKTFEKWLEKTEVEGANIFIAKTGQRIKAGKAQIYILHPFWSLEGEMFERSSNDSSVVAKLLFGQNTFLFTGDISRKVEEDLLVRSALPVSLAAEVLKISHHGSKTANSREFFEVLQPEIAVISCGKDNKYGHPQLEVLSNLREFGITILRTDELGDIKITTNGTNLKVDL